MQLDAIVSATFLRQFRTASDVQIHRQACSARSAGSAASHPSWGRFLQYANNEDVTVSLMTVAPGQRLSLQAHSARAEIWIVLDDGALIQVADEIIEGNADEYA